MNLTAVTVGVLVVILQVKLSYSQGKPFQIVLLLLIAIAATGKPLYWYYNLHTESLL